MKNHYPCIDTSNMRIYLKQPSVGPSASAGIECIGAGIDWDKGTWFIYPDRQLVSWEYLEKMIPDIYEQIEARKKRALKSKC